MIRTLSLALAVLAAPASFAQHHHGGAGAPTEAGQSAFAAITEIVAILEADPATDWSKVSIDALRRHLADMDNVVLHATAIAEPVPGGARFTVTGEGRVADSIRRMAPAQAAMIDGMNGWKVRAELRSNGALVTVTGAPADEARIRGLGYFGLLTMGSHHQPHHLMMAKGTAPH